MLQATSLARRRCDERLETVLTRQKEFFQWIVGGFITSSLIVGMVYVVEHRAVILTSVSVTLADSISGSSSDSSSPTSDAKMQTLNARTPASQSANKGGGQMNINLSSPNAATASAIEPLVIKAQVIAMANLADVRYEWILPDSVTPVRGSVTGGIGALADGAQGAIEISLNLLPGSENKQIHLQVYQLIDGERMGQVAQFNTVETKEVAIAAGLKKVEADDQRSPAAEKPRMMQ